MLSCCLSRARPAQSGASRVRAARAEPRASGPARLPPELLASPFPPPPPHASASYSPRHALEARSRARRVACGGRLCVLYCAARAARMRQRRTQRTHRALRRERLDSPVVMAFTSYRDTIQFCGGKNKNLETLRLGVSGVQHKFSLHRLTSRPMTVICPPTCGDAVAGIITGGILLGGNVLVEVFWWNSSDTHILQ